MKETNTVCSPNFNPNRHRHVLIEYPLFCIQDLHLLTLLYKFRNHIIQSLFCFLTYIEHSRNEFEKRSGSNL